MNNFEIDRAIKSMIILVDTREQDTERARRRLNALPCEYRRQALNYGDYSYAFKLPESDHYSVEFSDQTISPVCAIERKMHLDELAGCFTKSRERFEKEFERARSNNANVFLIVENASYENLINGKYRSRFNPKAFLASLIAWQIRYGIHTIFCKEETSPALIYEVCKRDLKERLERGDFDG